MKGKAAKQGQTHVCCWLGTKTIILFPSDKENTKKKREEKNWQKYYFVKLENVPTGVTET